MLNNDGKNGSTGKDTTLVDLKVDEGERDVLTDKVDDDKDKVKLIQLL